MEDEIILTTLRLPKKVKDKVEELAKANERSLNWMYVNLIKIGAKQKGEGDS